MITAARHWYVSGYNLLMQAYLSRFYVRDLETNITQMAVELSEASELGCDAVFFPEMFLTGYYGNHDVKRIRTEFAQQSARHPGLICFFGCISEDGHNRQLVYAAGKELARYDKVHLFAPNGEDEMWTPGASYVAVRHGGWTIGLATCNDVRFPEQGRALKLKHNIDMLIYPSLWPWARDHILAALVRARAIENGVFTVCCCVAGINNGQEQFDGAGNHVFDPLGTELHPSGRVYELERALLGSLLVDTRERYLDIADVELAGG